MVKYNRDMIREKVIDVTVRVHLEIETDQIGFGIHGGNDDTPDAISEEATNHFVQSMVCDMYSDESGIRVKDISVRMYTEA